MTFVPASVPKAMREDVAALLSDQKSFFSLLKIQHKTSKQQVPFAPNDAQWRFLELLKSGHKRIIVVKARQVGISTAMRAEGMRQAYIAHDPDVHAVLSFHERSAKYLRAQDQRWVRGLPALLKRKMATDNVTDMRYADTGAGVSAYTTGGRGGTRSFAFNSAHLSEFAFYSDADENLAQVDATVGATGVIVVESTVNVPGDAFHRLVAGAPQNGWELYTYWWWEYPDYTLGDLPEFEISPEEAVEKERYGLTFGQLAWRRERIATLTLPKFRREYPACMDDCFILRAGGYYDYDALQGITAVPYSVSQPYHLELEPPVAGDNYVLGADPSGGVGMDYSTICVVSVSTRQPVYVYRNNTIAPAQFAQKIAEVASRYNQALVLCESNNHGHAVLLELHHCRYHNLWQRAGKPWVTTQSSKLEAFEALRDALPSVVMLDQSTLAELKSLSIPAGKITPSAPDGMHDDSAMAAALAYRCYADVPAHLRNRPTARNPHGVTAAQVLAAGRRNRLSPGGP